MVDGVDMFPGVCWEKKPGPPFLLSIPFKLPCLWIVCHPLTKQNTKNQGWVIRTSETSYTVLYAIYTQYAYNTKTYLCYFGGYPGLAPTTLQPPRIVHQPPEHYNVKTLSGIVLLLWDRRGRFTRCQIPMPDARIPRCQQRCPPHPRALHEAESQRRCSSMQSWPGRNPQGVVAALASNGRNCRR